MACKRLCTRFQSALNPSCWKTSPLGIIKPSSSQARCMATETTLPYQNPTNDSSEPQEYEDLPPLPPSPIGPSQVTTTIYDFPSMEPLRFESYPASHLYLPLRRDLLQRAIVYEGDKTRQGTASTKWRSEVHGSGRKVRPQKGTGRARLGDKKSPMLRGGGVAFGPKPRDFSTDLPRKMYDLAWRIALSYRYRRGQLVIAEQIERIADVSPLLTQQIFETNGWGKGNGGSLIVTAESHKGLKFCTEQVRGQGRILQKADLDVKNLLELGRVIMEKRVLDDLLQEHQSDLATRNWFSS